MTDYTIGVDISKAHFDAHRLPDGAAIRFDNNTRGHKAFVKWLKGLSVKRVVYEPTGKYHQGLEVCLDQAGLNPCRVNPLHARRFAQATGTYAKTDAVDARILAVMGDALAVRSSKISCQKMRDLKELLIHRQGLIKDSTAARNRNKNNTVPLVKRQITKRIDQIKKDIVTIDVAMLETIMGDEYLARTFQIICSIPGLSNITAATMIIELPELGTLSAKQVASLSGLAPFARQSGQWKGKSFIGKGRKNLRDALYMPALVATRFNQDMCQMYKRLVNNGKAKKQAIVAVMRKLIILANSLVKQNRIWQQKTT